MKKTWRKDLTIRLWCDTIANVRVREGRDIPQWQWGCWRLPLETFSIHAPSWEVALITLHHATAKDLHMSFLRPLYYPRRGHSFFYLTFENIFNIMCIESERGTENPFQVSPCATGWPVRVDFSSTDDQQEKELRFWYSRVVRFRPRDA